MIGEYEVRITKQAVKDIGKLSPKMMEKLKSILTEVLSTDHSMLGQP